MHTHPLRTRNLGLRHAAARRPAQQAWPAARPWGCPAGSPPTRGPQTQSAARRGAWLVWGHGWLVAGAAHAGQRRQGSYSVQPRPPRAAASTAHDVFKHVLCERRAARPAAQPQHHVLVGGEQQRAAKLEAAGGEVEVKHGVGAVQVRQRALRRTRAACGNVRVPARQRTANTHTRVRHACANQPPHHGSCSCGRHLEAEQEQVPAAAARAAKAAFAPHMHAPRTGGRRGSSWAFPCSGGPGTTASCRSKRNAPRTCSCAARSSSQCPCHQHAPALSWAHDARRAHTDASGAGIAGHVRLRRLRPAAPPTCGTRCAAKLSRTLAQRQLLAARHCVAAEDLLQHDDIGWSACGGVCVRWLRRCVPTLQLHSAPQLGMATFWRHPHPHAPPTLQPPPSPRCPRRRPAPHRALPAPAARRLSARGRGPLRLLRPSPWGP
jgi:hypothetical protein